MTSPVPMKIIATMRSAFPSKFGIPRQSGLVAMILLISRRLLLSVLG